jgi:hypothetical protein
MIDTPGYAYGVGLAGDFLTVADNWMGIRIYDISDERNPREVGWYRTPGYAHTVTMDGATAYVADYTNVGIYDCSQVLSVPLMDGLQPMEFVLYPAYPNPFNSATVLRYYLPNPTLVSVSIFDQRGCKILSLFDGYQSTGLHTAILNAGDLPSGVYLVRLQVDDQVLSEKVTSIK